MECLKSERQRFGYFWITASLSFCSYTTVSSSRLDLQLLIIEAKRGSKSVNLYYNFMFMPARQNRFLKRKFISTV